jgi:hypothetical protein
MNVSAGALIIYALLLIVAAVGAGFVDWWGSDANASYTALRTMPANHLVLADDLRAESGLFRSAPSQLPLVGRYARHLIGLGERVSEESFDRTPSLDTGAMLSVSVARAAITGHRIDAGEMVKLCAGSVPLDTRRAQAAFCPPASNTACALLIAVDPRMLSNASHAKSFVLHAVHERDACQ